MSNKERDVFLKLGLIMPKSEEDELILDSIDGDYNYRINIETISPEKILDKINEESIGSRFFKRTVLAARIIYKSDNDKYLGKLKLQKLIYLIDRLVNLKLDVNFLQQEHGPYDPRLMRSLDKQFKIKRWFIYSSKEFPKYRRLENVEDYGDWFENYFSNYKSDIDTKIDFFARFKSDQIELVATLYACWEKMQLSNERISENNLVSNFYKWSSSKTSFQEDRILSAIKWMISENIYPKKNAPNNAPPSTGPEFY